MTHRRALPWLVLAATVLCAVFTALGLWQLQRMGWKHALIARVEARVQATPEAPPAAVQWPALRATPGDWEYRRLRLEGVYLHDQEALVQASTVLGAGHWVLTPLRLADGSVVIVNRGFVPPAQRDPQARGEAAPTGPVVVTGLLRTSEPRGGFLRNNDPAAGRWFSRDVAAIAATRVLPSSRVAPYFVDAEATGSAGSTGSATAWPRAGLTVLQFRDNHLVYALTWFVLAGLSLTALVPLLRLRRAPPRTGQGEAAAA